MEKNHLPGIPNTILSFKKHLCWHRDSLSTISTVGKMSSFYGLIDLLYPNQRPCIPPVPGFRDLSLQKKIHSSQSLDSVRQRV